MTIRASAVRPAGTGAHHREGPTGASPRRPLPTVWWRAQPRALSTESCARPCATMGQPSLPAGPGVAGEACWAQHPQVPLHSHSCGAKPDLSMDSNNDQGRAGDSSAPRPVTSATSVPQPPGAESLPTKKPWPTLDREAQTHCFKGLGLPQSTRPPKPLPGLTGEGHAHVVVQGTDLPHRPLILQLGHRLLLHTQNNNVFSSDAHLQEESTRHLRK